MANISNLNLDYDRPLRIAEDVHWVGVCDPQSGANSNSYLIVDGDEAILIDGGSRSDFSSVMMKIMQTGVVPSAIMALVYQNYNPRLCSSLPHLEMIINRDDLKIVSHHANHMFIQHYSESAKLVSLEDINFQLTFSSGRQLEFINTPFAHSAGSLVTFDPNSGILFTGDLFSSYSSEWDLLLRLDPKCRTCRNYPECPDGRKYCQIFDTLKFHQNIMTSERALKYALDRIATVPFTVVAPQHGSVIDDIEDILALCEMLSSLKGVGIDGVIGDKSFFELGDTSPIRERLYKANGLS